MLVRVFEPHRMISFEKRERLRVHPDPVVAECVAGAHPARDRADRHEVAGGAEDVPEPPPGGVDALEQAHAPGAEIRPYGLGAELLDRALEPLADLVERRVPGDPLEVARALRADAPHRIEETLGRLAVFQVAVHLVAEDTAGEGMLGVALQGHGAPILHRDDPAARVRAVERARPEDPARAVRGDARIASSHEGTMRLAGLSVEAHAGVAGRGADWRSR